MAHEQAPPTIEEAQALSIFTPVNAILLSLFVYLVYTRLRPTPPPKLSAPSPIVFKTFTPKTLRPYNGIENSQVYLGVQGKVFDVTAGKSFYGPGGPYSNFAGRDASRGLAKNSFDQDMLTDFDKPLDLLDDLNDEEKGSLRDWAAHFEGKYLLVGRLVNEGSEEAKEAGL
ncbi:cytochrome b5 [Wilcoxina mikolae CBS 423.85]|nr:cytochrome b5 [Wilcoxina mikolae CBS 423.85]